MRFVFWVDMASRFHLLLGGKLMMGVMDWRGWFLLGTLEISVIGWEIYALWLAIKPVAVSEGSRRAYDEFAVGKGP